MTTPTKAQLDEAFRACEFGDPLVAISLYKLILDQFPNHLGAEIGLTRAYFYAEQWLAAWNALEVRFRLMPSPPNATRTGADRAPVPFPRWAGGPVPPRMLVLDEQGLGDTIQFCRFIPGLVAAGCRVILVTHPRLLGLLKPIAEGVELRANNVPGRAHGIDAWCPLLSIPGALGLTPQRFTPKMPYLVAEPDRVARWRHLAGGGKPTVGVCWLGNPNAPVDKGRSATLAALAPLAAVDGVHLVSLQVGGANSDIAGSAFATRITIPGPDFDTGLDAFLDTAALIMSLDLVVTVDTAIAHLAGALGRPVWIGLRTPGPDWRWLRRETDTPWYPTARLFRQRKPGDWWEVFCRMADRIRTHGVGV